jgi:ATP-dependent Clp protease ATP-binding subunit ClpB
MSKLGVTDQSRPLGSFLFMGNTGVGKTELGKSLAEALFDDENAIVRIDMSEYMEQHSVAKLIGSPPGYVGYDEGGQLTEKIRRRPYSVLLFDEIEKAHPNVLNILLQILDDGRLTDAKGRTVNFKNTIIIMTSNMASKDVKQYLRPEFINRIDEIITFNDLNGVVIRKIVDIQLDSVQKRLSDQNISLEVDGGVKEFLVKNGYVPEYGARPINRIIKHEILAKLSKFILENPDTNAVKAIVKEGQIQIV